jgi:hypothetical protein
MDYYVGAGGPSGGLGEAIASASGMKRKYNREMDEAVQKDFDEAWDRFEENVFRSVKNEFFNYIAYHKCRCLPICNRLPF